LSASLLPVTDLLILLCFVQYLCTHHRSLRTRRRMC
jgi:hypothetical protein